MVDARQSAEAVSVEERRDLVARIVADFERAASTLTEAMDVPPEMPGRARRVQLSNAPAHFRIEVSVSLFGLAVAGIPSVELARLVAVLLVSAGVDDHRLVFDHRDDISAMLEEVRAELYGIRSSAEAETRRDPRLDVVVGWTECARRLVDRMPRGISYNWNSTLDRERAASALKQGVRSGKAPIFLLLRGFVDWAPRRSGVREEGVRVAEQMFRGRA